MQFKKKYIYYKYYDFFSKNNTLRNIYPIKNTITPTKTDTLLKIYDAFLKFTHLIYLCIHIRVGNKNNKKLVGDIMVDAHFSGIIIISSRNSKNSNITETVLLNKNEENVIEKSI